MHVRTVFIVFIAAALIGAAPATAPVTYDQAKATYAQGLIKAKDAYERAISAAQDAYAKDLQRALDGAFAVKDLPAANKIDAEIKSLRIRDNARTSPPAKANNADPRIQLMIALANTKWSGAYDLVVTLNADGTGGLGNAAGFKWGAIDEN